MMEPPRSGSGGTLVRTAWCLRHLASSLRSLLGGRSVVRDRGVLVLTHEPDIDRDGADVQMGAVVEELEQRGVPYFEVALVRLNREAWRRRIALRTRPWVSWVAPELVARVLALGRATRLEAARVRVMGWLLDCMRPRALLLIDEAGSGRALVAAARRRGIPSVGVQHGDFQPGNSQYDAAAGARAEPVDLLCVWSPFFQERLLAITDTYRPEALRVSGRARPPSAFGRRVAGAGTRVLVVARPGLGVEFEESLAALANAFELRIRPHPTSGPEPLPAGAREADGALAEELVAADLVLGSRTSAAFEALWWRRPYLELTFPAPKGFLDAVRERIRAGFTEEDERERGRVWAVPGEREENSASLIVGAALDLAVRPSATAQGNRG